MSTPQDPFSAPPPDEGASGPGAQAGPPGYGAAPPDSNQQQPGWGPPPAQGWQQPAQGWQQPAQGWQQPPGAGRPTNTLAIVTLVLIFTVTPAALVTGIIARRQIRETGEAGDGFALAGIIVGALSIAFFALLILGFVLVVAVGGGIGESVVVEPGELRLLTGLRLLAGR